MIRPPLGALASVLVALAQDSTNPAALSVDTVAARPEVAARGFRYLIGAYSMVWVILSVYLLTLSIRLRRLSQQVRRLRERIGF